MSDIWKFTVPVQADDFEIAMPHGSQIVHVASQTGDTRDGVQFWAIVNPRSARVIRSFTVVATGQPFLPNYTYRGTVLCGPFVWHLLEWVS